MDEHGRATTAAWAVLGRIMEGVLADRRGIADGTPARLAEHAEKSGGDARLVAAQWRISRYGHDEVGAWLPHATADLRAALTEIDRYGRQWWESLPDDTRPSPAEWKAGAHELVLLTAPADDTIDPTRDWLNLTWVDSRRLWIEDPEHPANGRPLIELADERVPILAATAAAAWLATALPDAEQITTELQVRAARFADMLS